MKQKKTAAVVGAGLVGIATAIALKKSGFDVEIFERRTAVTPDGFGIAITTNGMLALRELGIAESLIEVGARIDRAEIRDPQNRTISDLPMKRIALGLGDYSYGFSRRVLHGRLLELLGDVPIHAGAELTRVAERGKQAVAAFHNGHEAAYDLVVGADGVHSTMRRLLHGEFGVDNSNYVAWVAVANHLSPRVPKNYGAQWWGRGLRYSVQYLGPNQTYWWGTQTIPNTTAGHRRRNEPISARGIDREHFRGLFVGWAPELRSLIDEYLEHTPADEVMEINPRCHRPIERWSRGAATLAGDAAHAMFPSLATGASIGFEDAAVLMHCLRRQEDVHEALASYDTLRVDRTNRVLSMAKKVCWLETSPNLAVVKVRDFYFRNMPDSAMTEQIAQFSDFRLPREIAPAPVRALGANERWHWYSSQLNPLNMSCALRVEAPRALRLSDFEDALAALQAKYEILSTTVRPSEPVGLEYRSVSRPVRAQQLEAGEAATALELLNRCANETFAPDEPLMKLFWVADDHGAGARSGLLCLVCSHLIADGASLVRLTQELLARLAGEVVSDEREAIAPSLEQSLSSELVERKALRRALVTQTLAIASTLLKPGLRLQDEQRANFEDVASRFLRIELDDATSSRLDAVAAAQGLAVGDLATAALVRALGAELGGGSSENGVRVGRSYTFRELVPTQYRDSVQSSVAQAASLLNADMRLSLLELAAAARSAYERVWRAGEVLDAARVLSARGPDTLRDARKLAAIVRKSGPMHVSVTDLSANALHAPTQWTIAELSIANTLSCSGSLLLTLQRSGARLSLNLAYATPLVSASRAGRLALLVQAELEGAVAESVLRDGAERSRRAYEQVVADA
jgi:2-polyprenyl-6-methoxyphenol hydroxylase-like FAD-dependent oxidoreductase